MQDFKTIIDDITDVHNLETFLSLVNYAITLRTKIMLKWPVYIKRPENAFIYPKLYEQFDGY